MRSFFCLFALLLAFNLQGRIASAADDPYKVLPVEDEFSDQSIMLFKHLQRIPQERSWQRDVEVARIRNENDWNAYKEKLLRDYKVSLGLPFPDKTPLDAERVKVLDRGDYRIENIVLQSMPDVYVTANLYVPQKGKGPFPGIIFPCGHWHVGKAAEEYHSAALGLVQKGFVVLLFDPAGQGERCQFFKEDKTLLTQEPVIEHTLMANPLFLLGKHLMAVRIWDAMRGIDYLLSREEVDPERIGCTGNSGGGTVTLHLTPLEPRIKVAVPDGTVNTPELELGTEGISDGEQNIVNQVPYGITHADLMMLAWPRPYRLMIESRGGVRRGTRQSFVQARFLYETLGHPERMSLVETEWPHGLFKFSREKMYYWFGKWFYNREDGFEEPALKLESEQDLWCSKDGQIILDKGKSIQQWTAEQAEKIIPRPPVPKNEKEFTVFREELLRGIKEVLNNPENDSLPLAKAMGTVEIEGIEVEKIALYSEKDIYLPCLFFKPKSKWKIPTVVVVDAKGKTADSGALAKRLVSAGYGVFAVDLRGYGETRVTKNSDRDDTGGLMAQTLGIEASLAYDGLKLGRSIFAMRVYDLQKTLKYVLSRDDIDRTKGVALIGKSTCGPIALYAAALEKEVKGVLVDSSLAGFREIVKPELYTYNFIDFLPRALRYHDFPQVAAGAAPGDVLILNSLDARGVLKDSSLVRQDYSFTQGSFNALKAKKNFQVLSYSTGQERDKYYMEWVGAMF